MKPHNAYHITKIWNVESIVKNGLLPNCGENSNSVGDRTGGIFFTTYENIDFWVEVFKLNRSDIVILNFPAENSGNRIHEKNDLCTKKSIPADQIYVVTEDGNIPIKDFYLANKVKFEKLSKENIANKLENVLLMLRNILTDDYKNYTVYDCVNTLDLLAALSILNDKSEFLNYLIEIKNGTLQLLRLNGVNEEIENYRLIDDLFERILRNSESVSVSEIYELKQRIVHGFDFEPKYLNDIRFFKM